MAYELNASVENQTRKNVMQTINKTEKGLLSNIHWD